MQLMHTMPIMRAYLVLAPLMMGGRFMATAIWAPPVGTAAYSDEMHFWVYAAAAALCTAWSVFHTYIKVNAYIGSMIALVSMYRAVNTLQLFDGLGEVSYVAFIFWVTFAVGAIMTSMVGIQWCIVHRVDAERYSRRRVER